MGMTITVRTSFQGLHCWKDAPEQVAFLRNLHRHVFNVQVTLPVTHSDRDVEFFIYQNKLNEVIHGMFDTYNTKMPMLLLVGYKSCEMVAKELYDILSKDNIIISVSVDEDGENGGAYEPESK